MTMGKPRDSSYTAFPLRPWMSQSGAASAQGGSTGLKGVVAGGITGGIEICITYPTEYVKTQLQLDEKGAGRHYDGALDCVRKTIQRHGVLGLYRGLSVLLYGSVPKSAVRFGSFEFAKKALRDGDGRLSAGNAFLCGLFAGAAESVTVVTPMETVKVKFINDRRSPNPRFKGFIHGVKTMVRNEGIRGLYQGVVPTTLRQASNQAIRFFVMETLKNYYTNKDPSVHVPKYMIGFFGIIAGACSVCGNNPLDVVKTRMQGFEASKYSGTIDCFVKILKNEGPLAFYKGVLPRMSRVCLDVAITFMLYETFMEFFNKVWP